VTSQIPSSDPDDDHPDTGRHNAQHEEPSYGGPWRYLLRGSGGLSQQIKFSQQTGKQVVHKHREPFFRTSTSKPAMGYFRHTLDQSDAGPYYSPRDVAQKRGQEPIVRSTLRAIWLLVPDPFSESRSQSQS